MSNETSDARGGWGTALALGLCGGLVAGIAQGFLPAEATGPRLAAALVSSLVWGWICWPRIQPRSRTLGLAVFLGNLQGALSDLLLLPTWADVVLLLAGALGLTWLQLASGGEEVRQRLEAQLQSIQARASAYKAAVLGRISI